MMRLWLGLLIATSITNFAFARGPDYSVCETLVSNGLREFSIRRDSKENLDQLFTHYCSYSSSKNSGSFDFSSSSLINDIPESLTMGASTSEQKIQNFCNTYKSSNYNHETVDTYRETIAPRAYNTFEQCLKIVSHNIEITHKYSDKRLISFNIKADANMPIRISKIDAPDYISCTGVVSGQEKDFKSLIDITVLTTQEFSCTRPSNTVGDLDSGYPEASITIMNGIENYIAFWPAIPSGTIKAQAKSELEVTYKDKYERLKNKYKSILPASVTFWSWVTVAQNQTQNTTVTCPTGWKPLQGGAGPHPLTHVFDTTVTKTSDGVVLTGRNVAGGQMNQLLIAYVECSPPSLEGL
jgi:hypothetical protein